jgi:hypothetical protein
MRFPRERRCKDKQTGVQKPNQMMFMSFNSNTTASVSGAGNVKASGPPSVCLYIFFLLGTFSKNATNYHPVTLIILQHESSASRGYPYSPHEDALNRMYGLNPPHRHHYLVKLKDFWSATKKAGNTDCCTVLLVSPLISPILLFISLIETWSRQFSFCFLCLICFLIDVILYYSLLARVIEITKLSRQICIRLIPIRCSENTSNLSVKFQLRQKRVVYTKLYTYLIIHIRYYILVSW